MNTAKPVSDPAVRRIFEEGIEPHAAMLADITQNGAVACVVFEPDEETIAVARALGWDGAAPVFQMSAGAQKRLARNLKASGDIGGEWLETWRRGRVFALIHSGTLLLNFDAAAAEFSIVQGSTDKGHLS